MWLLLIFFSECERKECGASRLFAHGRLRTRHSFSPILAATFMPPRGRPDFLSFYNGHFFVPRIKVTRSMSPRRAALLAALTAWRLPAASGWRAATPPPSCFGALAHCAAGHAAAPCRSIVARRSRGGVAMTGGWQYALAGGVCAAVSHGIACPVDVVKTRQQTVSAAPSPASRQHTAARLPSLRPAADGHRRRLAALRCRRTRASSCMRASPGW